MPRSYLIGLLFGFGALVPAGTLLGYSHSYINQTRSGMENHIFVQQSIEGDDIGEVIYTHADKLDETGFTKFDWNEIFLWEGNWQRWDEITGTHTNDNEGTSPVISTTLADSVAADFGPGFAIIEVCPERALLTASSVQYLHELEFYVPFFILPEELVSIEGADCAVAIRKTDSLFETRPERKRGDCRQARFRDPRPAPAVTGQFRRCFFPSVPSTPTEDFYQTFWTTQRFSPLSDRFHDELAAAPSTGSWRQRFVQFAANDCQPTCAQRLEVLRCAKRKLELETGIDRLEAAQKPHLEALTDEVSRSCPREFAAMKARAKFEKPRCTIPTEDEDEEWY